MRYVHPVCVRGADKLLLTLNQVNKELHNSHWTYLREEFSSAEFSSAENKEDNKKHQFT